MSFAVSFIPLVGPLMACVIDGTFTDMWEAIKRGDWGALALCAMAFVPGAKALDAGRALERAEDCSNFFRWMDDYPEFARLGSETRETFVDYGYKFKVTFSRDVLLARYGDNVGNFYTTLISRNTDDVVNRIAWYRSAIEKGGGLYKIPAGKTGWIGAAGPQRLDDMKYGRLFPEGGQVQIFFPDKSGIQRVLGWSMI